MKKIVALFLVFAILTSMTSISMVTFADDTAVSEKVHFDIDFENYTSEDTAFVKTATGKFGSWESNGLGAGAGGISTGAFGNAFKIAKESGFMLYTPTTAIDSGKLLLSADISYKTSGAASKVTWLMNNSGEGDAYIYLLSLDSGNTVSATDISHPSKEVLLTSTDENTTYTIELLIDFDNGKKLYYVDGELKYEYEWDETIVPEITQFKFNYSNNINTIDNFKLVENPTKYSFSQIGGVTTADDCLYVSFSDSVNAKASDFKIDDGSSITVSGVEKINGKLYKLNLSDKLTDGNHTITLTNESLASVLGTTPENTEVSFDVIKSAVLFDADLDGFKGSVISYLKNFDDNGEWTNDGSAVISQSNTYKFEGDETNGAACTSESGTQNVKYTLTTPITSGKVTISFDAAFNSTLKPERTQLLYLNGDGTNGVVMNYGTLTDMTLILGTKKDMHFSGGTSFPYVNNKAYRWENVIDLDSNTVYNYCDGVLYNSVELTNELESVSSINFRFSPAVVFFDNYKVTHNVNTFDMKASDIPANSYTTYVDFGDTVTGEAVITFADSDGNTVTPKSVTKITPRRYKAVFAETALSTGTYTATVSGNVVSALGNSLKNTSATFNVQCADVPVEYVEYGIIAENPKMFDFEGSIANPLTYEDNGNKVNYNETVWRLAGGPTGGHIYALISDAYQKNGSYSVKLNSTDDTTNCAFYNNKLWTGTQGDSVSGYVWVYWPSTSENNYLQVQIANYTSQQNDIIATSERYTSANIPAKDQWIQIPVNPVDGMTLDGALQIKLIYRGIEPIYVDGVSIGTVKAYTDGYYVTEANHTLGDGSVTVNAKIRKANYWSDGATILGAVYDKDGFLAAIKEFECPVAENEVTVSHTFDVDNFKNVKWFVWENDGSIEPVADSKADYKTSFKIMSHNVGKYSAGVGAGVEADAVDAWKDAYLDFLAAEDCDVLCAQEHAMYFDIDETIEARDVLFGQYFDYNFLSSETKDYVYQGQAIYSKLPIKANGMGDLPAKLIAEIEGEETESQRGFTKIVVEIDGKEVAIFNSHLSIRGSEYRLESQRILIEEMKKYEYAVLCMDSNCSYDEWQQFVDAGFVLGNGGDKFVATGLKNNRNTDDRDFIGSSAIDTIIVTPSLELKNFKVINNSYFSDHYPVVAEIAIK